MRRFSLFAAAALAAVSAPALAASPVEGKWAVEAKTDFGTLKSTWTVAEKDGAVTLEVAEEPMAGMPAPESTISDVKLDGNTLTFRRELKMPQGAMTLTYSATVDGDAMAGTASSDFGPINFTGARL